MSKRRQIGIIGCGYVGLITGVCLAQMNNSVICYDVDLEKIDKLKAGIAPIYEKDLPALLRENRAQLTYTNSFAEVMAGEYLFICVGTPAGAEGEADTSTLYQVVKDIDSYLEDHPEETKKILIIKSTVPVGTAAILREYFAEKITNNLLAIVSNPEFLREGSAIDDFLYPDRVVIGAESAEVANKVAQLYDSLNKPILIVSNEEAEIIKYGSNSFLATKISFINEIANICDLVGADINQVAQGIGTDHRIGKEFLRAGLGFGGPCLNKDLAAIINYSQKELGYRPVLLEAALLVNHKQPDIVIQKLKSSLGDLVEKKVGLLGLAFKPGTDDMRNAPSLKLIARLLNEGMKITAYDPQSNALAKELLAHQIEVVEDPYQVAKGSSAIIIVTEWPEFLELDYGVMKMFLEQPILIDGRNLFSDQLILSVKDLGYKYLAVGRS